MIKSHGGADALAFQTAIHLAEVEIEQDITRRISDKVATTLENREKV